MNNIVESILASSYSGLSPMLNTAAAMCSVRGQTVECPSFLAGIMPLGFFIMIAFVALLVVSNWVIYTKAGKPGWTSIIPIYSLVVLLEIIKKPLWWIVLFFVPIVNIIMGFMLMYETAKAFGKGIEFTLGLIFLPFIFYPILAFGNAQYIYGDSIPPQDPNQTPTPIYPTPIV